MPASFISLIILMAFIIVCFIVIKRPIYEIMVLGYIVTIVCTGRYDVFWKNLIKPSSSSLFFAVVAFLLLAHILDETGVIQQVIDIVLSFVGRFSAVPDMWLLPSQLLCRLYRAQALGT